MYRILCCTALVALLGAGTLEASVVMSGAQHDVTVYNASPYSYQSQSTYSVAIPESLSVTSAIGGGTVTTYLTRSAAVFDYGLAHERTSSAYSYAQAFGQDLFTVGGSSPIPYTVAGTYAMTGIGTISFEVRLFEVASSLWLFDSSQQSYSTPDEVFTAGELGGDAYNYLQGSTSGMLQPGIEYGLLYVAYIQASSSLQGTATAEGEVSITFGSTAVPEPATLIIWSLLGASSWLGMRVWRRRNGAGYVEEMPETEPEARRSWSPEARRAIYEIISRGAPR